MTGCMPGAGHFGAVHDLQACQAALLHLGVQQQGAGVAHAAQAILPALQGAALQHWGRMSGHVECSVSTAPEAGSKSGKLHGPALIRAAHVGRQSRLACMTLMMGQVWGPAGNMANLMMHESSRGCTLVGPSMRTASLKPVMSISRFMSRQLRCRRSPGLLVR